MLSRKHLSVLRNPLIGGVFYRTGLIEQWGRGTNRVAEMCRAAGVAPPVFEEIGPFAVVTFRVRVGVTAEVTAQETAQVAAQVTPQVTAALRAAKQAVSAADLQLATGLNDRMHFLTSYLQPLLQAGWLERTIPDKPRSRLQRYRTTAAGLAVVKENESAEER